MKKVILMLILVGVLCLSNLGFTVVSAKGDFQGLKGMEVYADVVPAVSPTVGGKAGIDFPLADDLWGGVTIDGLVPVPGPGPSPIPPGPIPWQLPQ